MLTISIFIIIEIVFQCNLQSNPSSRSPITLMSIKVSYCNSNAIALARLAMHIKSAVVFKSSSIFNDSKKYKKKTLKALNKINLQLLPVFVARADGASAPVINHFVANVVIIARIIL